MMSGLEIYGALAATASLVKVAVAVKKYCNRTAEELKALEEAKISDLHQITSLRTIFKTLALSFEKYNTSVIDSLSQEDKNNIREIVKDAAEAMERCEDTMSRLRALTKKRPRSNSKFDILRGEITSTTTTIQCLLDSFNTYINLETLRRVSLSRQDSGLESLPPPSRQATINSVSSMQTLTPTLYPESSYSSGSSSGSPSCSPSLALSTEFVESKQLRSAVEATDSKRIEQLIRQNTTEAEKESWRASALFLACTFRRKSVVQSLLTSKPNVHIIDDSGLGVMHATIGLSEQLSVVTEQDTADILELLVNHKPSLIRSKDKQKRQPLHHCAMTGNYRAARYILSADPSRINATDGSRKTPLYHICEHHSPNKKLVELLLQRGGDFGTRNRPTMKDVKLAQARKMLDEEEKKRQLTRKPEGEP